MSKLLKIKEAFYTLHGEGARAGRASVFIRFSKCNLWNGKESGRAAALCQFCDTDITGTDGENGGEYSLDALVNLALSLWPNMGLGEPYIVFTGGGPALHLSTPVLSDFKNPAFSVELLPLHPSEISVVTTIKSNLFISCPLAFCR